jgi:murein DD-endopeptidase MepM/ murein hydrolase activator NlpD
VLGGKGRDERATVGSPGPARAPKARRRLGLGLAAALAGGLLPLISPAGAATPPPAPAPASRQDQIEAELKALQAEVSEARAEEARVLAELRVSQRLRADLDAQVASLDAALATKEQELAEVQGRLSDAAEASVRATRQADSAGRDLSRSRAVLRDQAISAYIGLGQRRSLPDILGDIEDVNEAPRVVVLVEAAGAAQAKVIDRFRRQRAELDELQAGAKAAKEQVAAEQGQVVRQKAELDQARAALAAGRAAAQAEVANEERLLAAVRAGRAEDEQRIKELKAESQSIAELLRRLQTGQGSIAAGKGVLAMPLANPSISSSFGPRVHPIFGDERLHAGIDLRADTGTPILAAADGKVVFAGAQRGYGNVVIVDHGKSLATLYAHQSVLSVRQGDVVKRGQVIGAVGATGYATGPHLHFEVRVGGNPVDPIPYL